MDRTLCVADRECGEHFPDQIYAMVSNDKVDYANFSHVDTMLSEPVRYYCFGDFGVFAVSSQRRKIFLMLHAPLFGRFLNFD